MPTNLSPVGVCNLALAKIGSQSITSLSDQFSSSAIICSQVYDSAVAEVSRAGRWNCLLVPAQLTEVTQPPVVPSSPTVVATAWAPLTAYLANDFITFGGYYYNVMFNLTSSASFINDLTQGYYTQTDQSICSSVPDPFAGFDGSQYTSTWPYAFALPSDFQLLVTLNGSYCYPGWASPEQMIAEWQIMGSTLYCNQTEAVIQYVQDQPDSTRFDSLFVNALTFKIAALICTPLRQDGGNMQVALLGEYKRALREAQQKNGGEQVKRRFNPIATSMFNAARYRGLLP